MAIAGCLAACATGCRSSSLPPSAWPAPDFAIEVLANEVTERGDLRRSFRVWADGTALYREAQQAIEGVPDHLPIYRRVALYVLDPRSTRTLARELGRAGLLSPTDTTVENRVAIGADVRIAWWWRGDSGEANPQQRDRGPLDRALRVVDAFVPPGCGFGDSAPEVVHVADVPIPLRSTAGALEVHVGLFRRRPVDSNFLREVFALAIAAREWGIAADALREIEERGPGRAGVELIDPEAWRRDELEPLRAVLARASAGA